MKFYIYIIAALLIAGGIWYYGHTRYEAGSATGTKEVAAMKAQDAKDAKSRTDAAAAQAATAKAAEALQRAHTASAERQMLEDFQSDKNKQAAVIAQLRAGSLRLRTEWQCPSVPGTGSIAIKPDDSTKLREQDASNLVRNAADADAQIRALQAVLIGERQ